MATKRNPTRYSIQFDEAIPSHQEAMRTLDEAGRGKAALIADAICIRNALYNYKKDAIAEILRNIEPSLNPAPLLQNRRLEATQEKLEVADITSKTLKLKEPKTSSTDQSSDDYWESIDDTLEMFQL